MTRLATLSCFFVVFGMLATPARAAKEDPDEGFLEPRAEVTARVRRVGVLPLELPVEFRDRTPVATRAHELLKARLTEAGFTVVEPTAWIEARDAMNRQLGGVYDPRTGRVDREKYKALDDHAFRTFVEKEQLDAVAESWIAQRKASFNGNNLYWDGAQERTSGRPMNKNLLKAMWYSPEGTTGSLPALSVVVALRDPNQKLLYGMHGGIQPLSYRDNEVKDAPSTFLDVPRERLLQDVPRMERAVRLATANLLPPPADGKKRTPEPEAELPPLPPAEVARPEDPFRVPRAEVLARVKTVAVAPLEVTGPDQGAEVSRRVNAAIAARLASGGFQVVEVPSLSQLWKQEQAAGFHDPLTGLRDEARESARRREVTGMVMAANPADAVLWPRIAIREVEHAGGDVEWDGADQNALTLGPVKKSLLGGSANYGAGWGSLTALSLAVTLRAPDDAVLYESYGGIQLMDKLVLGYNSSQRVPLTTLEMFTDPARDERAAYLALRPLLLTPEALEAELDPKGAARKARANRQDKSDDEAPREE